MVAPAQRYRLLASLVGLTLALLYSLVATGNARAGDPLSAAGPAPISALQAAGEVMSAGEVDTPAPLAAPVPAATSQQASTNQSAGAAASATQQQPRNVVVSVRINSPGNDGPISQTNVAGSGAGASNQGSTDQGQAPGGQGSSQQEATTNQGATAVATTTQEQPQNIVILIRINSPGDNGSIDQTNLAVSVSTAGNVSVTRQDGSGYGGADETAAGSSPDPRAVIGPPAQQAASPAGALPRMMVARRAPAARRLAMATGHRVERPSRAARRDRRPAVHRVDSAPSSTQQAVSPASSDPAASATFEGREPVARVKPLRRPAAAAGDGGASKDPGAGRRAVDWLGQLAPPSPARANDGENDVTNAVVLTLIAILGALLVFLGSTYLSSGLRQLDPRSWRHG